MRKIVLLSVLLASFISFSVKAQVTVTGDGAGGSPYPNLQAAIAALPGTLTQNTVISVDPGNSQTAPTGGYNITTTGTSSFSLTITGNSNTVTAGVQAAGTVNDGVFKIIGGDYITIQGFTIQENGANTVTTVGATNTMTEWGIALLNASLTDGPQNNTIQNNSITLNRAYFNSFAIYSNSRHAATTPATTADATSAAGSQSNNKFYGNTISNVAAPICIVGSSVAAAFGTGNDIGGTGAGTGNTITNWGANTAPSSGVGVSGTIWGIYLNHQTGYNVQFNSLTSASLATTTTTQGIFATYVTTTAATGTFTNTISNNTITFTTTSTGAVIAINATAMSALATSTYNISSNNIIGSSAAGAFTGIVNSNAGGTVSINSNIIRSNTITATTGAYTGISNTGAVQTALSINNNQLGNATGGFITYSAAISSALIGVQSTGTLATNATASISGNDFRGITHSVAGSNAQTYINITGATGTNVAATVQNNTFTNLNVNTTGSVVFISHNYAISSTGTLTLNNNSIVTAFNKAGAGGTNYCMFSNSTSTTGSVINYTNNNFSNFTLTGATPFTGIQNTDGGSGSAKTVTGNTFNSWTGGTSALIAINITYWSGTSTVSNNTITNITGQGAVTGMVFGTAATGTAITANGNTINNLTSTGTGGNVIGINAGASATTVNISGNTIHTLSSTNTSGVVSGLSFSGATTTNIFGNKIYNLSGNQAGSTTNGINITSGTTYNIYNNVIGDLKATAATGLNAVNGINASASSTYNIYFNNIVLNASSTGATFGSSCITFSSTATSLNLRNNMLINVSTPGTDGSNVASNGIAAVLRRSGGTAATFPANYAITSNKNSFWANPAGGTNNHLTYVEGTSTLTNAKNTFADWKTFANVGSPRDQASVSEQLGTTTTNLNSLVSLTGSNADFLRIADATTTLAEKGADPITTPSITVDYKGITGNRATTPDIGAYEFAGTTPAPANANLTVPANTCISGNGTTVSVDASTPSGVINGVTITYNNGTATGPVAMTGPDGSASGTWTFTIPAGTAGGTVTWSVTSTNSVPLSTTTSGTSYVYLPLNGATATAIASNTTICSGSSLSLSATVAVNGVGDATSIGTGTSATAPAGELTAFCNRRVTYQHQAIFTAAELIAAGLGAGNITAIKYTITSVGDASSTSNYTVKMGHTALNALTTSFVSTGLTTVRNSATYNHAVGVNTITLDVPFNWDGISNIIIDVTHGGIDNINNAQTLYTTQTTNKQSYGYNGATTATLSLDRLNVIFSGQTSVVKPVTSITWNDGTSNVGTGNPLILNPTSSATYRADLTAVGCTTSVSSSPASPTVAVTVNPLPATPTNNSASPQCGLPTFAITTAVTTPVVKWYTAASGGSPISTSSSLSYVYNGFTGGGATNTLYATVTDGNGCESARLPVSVVVNDPTTLTISPSGAQNACVNDIKTITVTSPLGNYSSYTWSPATNLFTDAGATTAYDGVSSATTIYYKRTSATASEVITLTATDGVCTATQTVTYTVSPIPVVTSVSATPATLCGNSTVTLAAASIAAAAGSGTITGTTTTDLGSGVYRNGFGTGDFRHQLIYTAAEMTAAGFVTGNITSLSFNVSSSGSGSYNNYIIRMANIGSTNAVSTSFLPLPGGYTEVFNAPTLAAPSAAGTYTHPFSNNFNWDGTSNILIDICYNVTVSSGSVTLTMTNNTTQNCQLLGGTNACTATTGATVMSFRPIISFAGQVGTNNSAAYAWTWATTLGAPAIANGFNSSHVPANVGTSVVTGTYTATATLNGCSGSLTSSVVTVNPQPVVPTANSTTPQCGQPTYSVSTAQASPVIKWYSAASGGTLLFTGAVGVLTYTAPTWTGGGATNTVYASVTNSLGCESGRTAVAVVVNDPPALTTNVTNATACVGEVKQLFITNPLGNFSNYSWTPSTDLWFDNAATSPYSSALNATTIYYKPISAGSHVITVTATGGGCTATATVTYTVSAYPVITSVTATPATLCSNNTVTLAGSSIQATAGTTNVGAGASSSTTYHNPFYGLFSNIHTQHLITAAELTAAGLTTGNLTSVGMNFTTANSAALLGVAIKIGTTTATDASAYIPNGSFSTIYTNASLQTTTGLNTFTFSSPFFWDGTSNIVLDFCYGNPSTTVTNVSTVNLDNTSFVSSNYFRSTSAIDAATACASTTLVNSFSARPQFVFGGQVGTNTSASYVWTWTTTLGAPSIANGFNTSHVPVNAGPGAVTGTYTATATLNGCSSTPVTSSVITVNPPAAVPTAQPTALVLSPSSTSIGINFTPASPVADGYLVVRSASQPTNPVNGTVYTAGASALGGVIVGVGLPPFTDNGLTVGSSYTYWVYSYNGTTICAGPVYLVTAPLTATVTTCPAAPVVSAATAIATGTFTANWQTTAGAAGYLLDVSTSSSFSSFLPGYNSKDVLTNLSEVLSGLTGNTYFYRVRSYSGACISSNSATQVACVPATLPYLDSLTTTLACGTYSSNNTALWAPDTDNDGVPAPPAGFSAFTGLTWTDVSNTTALFTTPAIDFTSAGAGTTTLSLSIYRNTVDGLSSDLVKVFVNTTPNTITGGTELLSISLLGSVAPVVTTSGWYKYTATIPASFNTGNAYIVIQGQTTTSLSSYSLGVADLRIQSPCTAPATQPTALTFLSASSTAINESFTAAGDATGYLVLRTATGIAPDTNPVDGTAYAAGATLGNATVVYLGANTSFTSTGLVPSTTYRYTVYSYKGDCGGEPKFNITSPLFGEAATLGAQNITSVASGSWKNPNTWSPAFVPSRYDFVTIAPGHTVTIDTTAFDSTLLVAQSAILQFDATTAYTLTSGSNVTINGPGIFRSALTGTVTGHNLIVYGNLTVNGGGGGSVLDFSTNNNTAGANLIFRGATNNTYTANGNTNDLRTLTIDKGTDITSTLEITNSGFTVQGTAAPVTTADSTAHGFLTLTNGQLKISTATSPTLSRLFSTASYTIPVSAGLWLNSAALTVQGMSGSSPTVNGSLRITAGTLNVGRASDNSLGAGTNAVFNIEGGALNVAGRFTSTSDVNYTQSGGVVTVNTVGNTSSSVPSFGFTSAAVANSFTMSGGTIVLQKASTATTPFDYRNHSGTVNITGGSLQFGTATSAAASTFVLTNNATTSTIVIPPVTVGVVGVAQTLSVAGTTGTGSAVIYGGLTVNTGSSLVHNNTGGQQIRVTGNVVNNGTIDQGASASAGNRFFFDSSGAARTYTGTGTFGNNTTPYPGISITNPNGVDLSGASNNIITGRINIFTGAVTGGNKVTLGNAGTSSVFVQRGGIVYANAGTIDVAPVNNAGTGGFGVIYSPALNAVTSGAEIPTSRTLKLFQTGNTNTVTLAGGNVATDSLVLGGGNVITNASNLITVTGTNTNKVTRTSGWVTGPLRITLASGTTAGTYQLPVGKTTYAGFELLSPVTSASGIVETEFTEGPTNGFPGTQMVSLNEQGYWHATDLSTILTSTRIRVTSPVALNAGTDALAQSNDATLTGTYDYVGSNSPNVPAGTISSDPTPLITSLGYFTIGTKGIPMVYDSATTFQTAGTTNITAGVSNQQLIGVKIHTTNNNPAMTLNSMIFNLQGSKPLANLDGNVSAVRLFSTGNSNTFATTTQVGNQVEPPFTAPYEFTISDAITLLPGDNYFWLAVDVPGSATLLDTLDAQCTSINITDNNTFNTFDSIPRVTSPAGNRVIKTILNGDYSIGTGNISGEAGHYASLTAAIAVLNDVGVTGPVNFVLTDTAYTTGETFPLTINAFTGASSTNRLTIKPNTGVNAAIRGTTGTTTNTALIILNGADYVTIDGSFSSTANTVCPASSASRNLTITNLGTSTSSAVVWLRASATDSATNNIVRNCNIVGNSNTTTLIGVGAGSATVSLTTLAVRANINNSYINNSISKTQNGIVTQGVSAARKTSGTVISQNLLNTASPNNIQKGGILVGFDNGTVISGNKIAGMTAADSYGISLGTSSISTTTLTGNEVINATVSNNVITNMVTTTSSSSVGIVVMSAATGTNTISNNMISGLNSQGTSGDITAGIFIGGGAGTTNIFYNSISLTGDRGSTSTSLYPSYALAIGGTNPIVNVRNNILYNTQTSNSTSTNFRSYAIAVGYTAFTNLTSNNNDLFVSGANAVFGLRGSLVPTSGTAVASLAAWQATPGKDLNSKNVAPVFIAADDLHLLGTNASNVANLVGTGAAVAVTGDIDCETRATLSTMGADELVPCTGAIGGTLTPPATSTFCAASTVGTAITASGYSTPLNGSYQWQSSLTPGFETPVDIAGATNPATYTISPVVTVTTYYRLKVRCSTSADSAYSNTVTITINAAPTATIAAQGGITVFCTPIPGTVTLNGSTNLSSPTPVYQWQLNGADISGANNSSYSVPSLQIGNYTLKVTNTTTTCAGTSSITTVSSSARPGAISFTPPTPAICAGQNVSITASGGAIGSTGSGFIGTGTSVNSTTSYPNPLSAFYGGTKTQMLFTAAELSALGLTSGTTITAIGFDLNAVNTSGILNDFTIRMANTSSTSLSDFISGTSNVYNQSYTPSVTGPVSFTLTAPFVWTGGNLVVETVHNAGNGGNGSGTTTKYTTTAFNSVYTAAKDNVTPAGVASFDAASGFAAATGAGASSSRPNVSFGYNSTANPIWSWTASPDLNTTSGNVVIATPAATSGTVNYTATATSPAGCTTNGIVTVTVNPVPTTTADSASFRTRLASAQTTTLPYLATQSPTTYSIVWEAGAISEGFANVTDAVLPASPITINIPANVNAATYTGNLTVKNANTCTSVSDPFTLIIVNGNPVWTGNTNTDWNTGSNWSTGLVPATGVNVTIDRITTNNPILATNVTIGQLDIAPNNTVTLNGRTLTANGGITNNTGTLIGSNTSSIAVGAASTLRFGAGAGTLKNLTVSAGTTTLATALDITGGSGGINNNTFGTVTVASGATLASGGLLTFKSNASGTARIAAGSTASGWVTGNVTVERYIPANAQRAWRFLSVPTAGTQKIKQAWQENGSAGNYNPVPGFGTGITSNVGPYATLIANGFDEYTTKASMQRWNQAVGTTGNWVDITATQGAGTTGNIATTGGYALYVRGDRTQFASGAVTSTTPTTLRTTGTLYTGDQANTAIGSGRFELIGNTYVSAIDFLGLNRVNMVNSFYLWDPKLVTGTPPNQTLGGYVTFSLANGFVGIPNNSSYGITPNTTIQSGEAFLVQANAGGGSIGMREAAKVAGNGVNMFRPATAFEKLKANLYTIAPDNTENMADANVSVFDNLFSDAVDGDDAAKLSNAGENFAIRRDGANLVVEGRNVTTDYDTTYFWMWNLRQGQPYKLELIAENMNVEGRTAYLVDNFTGTTTQLDLVSGTTNYNFNITSDGLSRTADRFKVIYRQVELAPVPVSFISVNAQLAGAAVKIDWKVAGETAVREYVVERSSDGRKFTGIGNVTATGNNRGDLNYSWIDASPLTGTNFYRIKSVGVAGEIKYTYIVKVLKGSITPSFTIAPNPVEGSVVNIQFKNQVQGRYTLRLLATGGEAVFTTVTEHAGGNSTQVVNLPSGLARGAYQLEIISPDKTKEVQNLFINTLK